MQSSAWIALLRHIPAEQQNRFMLVTVSGTEIAIQSFLLIEQEFVAFKGRLSGTQDTGRVFFIPYAHIDYFGFSQPVKDAEFNEMFAALVVPAPSLALASTPGSVPESDVPAPPEEAVEAPADSGSGPRPAIRSEVLERFRSRSGQP
jgi:hypothetical protein